MSHSSNVPSPYPNWDCGPDGNIVGGNQREEWSPCNAMDFRRIYTEYNDNWCLPGNITICVVNANSIYETCLQAQVKHPHQKDQIILATGRGHFGRFLGFSDFSKGFEIMKIKVV